MWDAWSTEANYRAEQIRRARGVEPDHHQPRARRLRPRRTRRTATTPHGAAVQ